MGSKKRRIVFRDVKEMPCREFEHPSYTLQYAMDAGEFSFRVYKNMHPKLFELAYRQFVYDRAMLIVEKLHNVMEVANFESAINTRGLTERAYGYACDAMAFQRCAYVRELEREIAAVIVRF